MKTFTKGPFRGGYVHDKNGRRAWFQIVTTKWAAAMRLETGKYPSAAISVELW